ncbi:MAG: relaxase/mobilization nuclease domain-containing protein, partial [Solobacterium sp.]|nr:relaxase/mobilization nuclease domain-containing protein [Solobacterium sp.]
KAHPHNHFVVNSVSWTDGRKFDNSRKDYQRFSSLSDDLARQYGLSVIEKSQGKSRHYAEWKSDQEYKPTLRSMIKEDIDYVISNSESFKEFEINLRKLGYELKRGKHLAVRAQGGKRFIRLYKLSDKEDYSVDAIKEKILNNSVVHFRAFYTPEIPATVTIAGRTKEIKKLKGFQALYVKYMFQMGILPEHQIRNQRVPFSMKQDLKHLDEITEQVTYLFKYEIIDKEALVLRLNQLTDEKAQLTNKSRNLYNLISRSDDSVNSEKLKSDRESIQVSLKQIRKEIRLCNKIQDRAEALDTMPERQERIIYKNVLFIRK